MKTVSVYGLIILLTICVSAIVPLEAWSNSAVATNSCGEEQSADADCDQNERAFTIMLPFVVDSEQVVDNEQPPNDATPLPTNTLPAEFGTQTPSPTSTLPPAQSTPTHIPTPAAPTSSIPPTATSPPTPTDAPSTMLFDPPSISAQVVDGNRVQVSWECCQEAESVRVLYGQIASRPNEVTTQEGSATTLTGQAAGEYQILVECYDGLGNSVFSSPTKIEVQ